MNKTKKRVFGLLGLAIVAAITIFAAFLPAPNASAATAGSSTVLRVRVIGDIPDVTITDGPISVAPSSPIPIVTDGDQSFTYINEKVGHIIVTLHYTDGNGHASDYVIAEYDTSYDPSGRTFDLNLDDYGYGNFIITVGGTGQYGADEDSISFDYVPVTIDAEQPAIDEDPIATYVYDPAKTDHAVLNVYTDDGQLISSLADIPVTIGNFTSTLPFEANNMEKGYYKVEIVLYNEYDEVIGTAIDRFYYDLSDPGPGPGPSTTVDIEAEQPAVDEDPIATYSYDPDITDHAILNVYDDEGNLITVMSEIPVTIGEYTTTLPFGENNMEEGYYNVEIITYDEYGNVIGTDIDRFYYDLSGSDKPEPEPEPKPEPQPDDDDTPSVPNTGLFTNLNISRADYVTTSLIIFFAATTIALGFILKKGRRRR